MRITLIALLLLALPLAASAQNSPIGRWKTIDDDTGKVKSIVEIKQAGNGTYMGSIVELLNRDGAAHPVCDKCAGANKNKPIKGMTILWGLKGKGSAFEGGTILDPGKGKTYKSKIKVMDGGKKLGVSGCVAFICREQVWVREG